MFGPKPDRNNESLVLTLTACAALAACAAPAEDVSRSGFAGVAQNIILGDPTQEHPAVVQLWLQTTDEATSEEKTFDYCTGTLIAPDRVLTAAHCLADSFWRKGKQLPLTGIRVAFASDTRQLVAAGDAKGLARATAWYRNPDAPARLEVDSYVGQHDTGVVVLDQASVRHIQPLPVTFNPPSDEELALIPKLIVGFGATEVLDDENREPDPRGMHTKRAGEPAPVARTQLEDPDPDADFLGAFNGTWVAATDGEHAASCHGDSGGPLLLQLEGQWTVAAVITRGERYCDGPTFYAPLSASEGFLKGHVSGR